MKKTELGKFVSGGKLSLNLDRLIETRLLETASSGGGKSFTLRLIMEGAYKKKQILIIDTEGEFSTLRPLHDFLILGKDGDVGLNPRHGGAYAIKFLELGLDVVIDLSELDLKASHRYVCRGRQALQAPPGRPFKARGSVTKAPLCFRPCCKT